jgi:tetratricopeptide (TPR) repeat protein
MSRAEKQLRGKRRKQRKILRQTWSNRSISDLDRDVPPRLLNLEYEITDEPIELPAEREPKLHAAIANRRHELFDRVHNDPASVIPDLEALPVQFPSSRILMNWLASAYQKSGNPEKSDELVKRCHDAHPDYLFARTNLASIHLEKGEITQAEAIMHNAWDLKLMYPSRNVFHISEFVAMALVAINYYMHTGKRQAAKVVLEAMTEIAPDHEATKTALNLMAKSVVSRAMYRLLHLSSRRRRGTNQRA